MQSAEAAVANLRLSFGDLPSACATANAPRKQSPAPVVSTIFFGSTFQQPCSTTSSDVSPLTRTAPSFPRVTSTLPHPLLMSSLAASTHCSFVSVFIPVARASSVSLGEISSRHSKSSFGKVLSSPPTSIITGTLASEANLATCRLTRGGISCWRRTAPADLIAFFRSSCNSFGHWLFAAPTMMIEFSPFGSRKMKAWPLGHVAFRLKPPRSAKTLFSTRVLQSSSA
mmetsp:Transcript_20754/g.40091  ORF Transcript_20754/g.40091 Transcript_20754/m.40091 type:complete len:227 (+) Transcript_20754:463-1143(+)